MLLAELRQGRSVCQDRWKVHTSAAAQLIDCSGDVVRKLTGEIPLCERVGACVLVCAALFLKERRNANLTNK